MTIRLTDRPDPCIVVRDVVRITLLHPSKSTLSTDEIRRLIAVK